MRQDHIRNFCIVAHIDHGKSTLADRLIELTGTLDKRLMREQVLDTMDLERERGITIKLNAVRMSYHAKNGQLYELNLIDTPGHVDFTYEVSRSLVACEGAILVVDASQGIQAQTLSNLLLAMDAGLEIIPVLNKIDLPGAEPDKRAQEIHDLIGTKPDEILRISAKEGRGVPELLEAVVRRVPPPRGNPAAPLRALIFDSYYDRYRGAIPSIRVVDGAVGPGMKVVFGAHRDDLYEVDEVGYLQLGHKPAEQLEAGEVGYVVANVRGVREIRPGDTVFDAEHRDVALRAGNLGGAGIRLPLRLPRPAPYGDRTRATGARVRSRPDQYRPERGVPRLPDRWHHGAGRESELVAARLRGRPHRGAVRESADLRAGGIYRRYHEARPRATRGLSRHAVPGSHAGRVRLGIPARGDHSRLL